MELPGLAPPSRSLERTLRHQRSLKPSEDVMNFFQQKKKKSQDKLNSTLYDADLMKAIEVREQRQQQTDFYYTLSELIERIHVFQEKFLSRQPKFLQKINPRLLDQSPLKKKKKEKIIEKPPTPPPIVQEEQKRKRRLSKRNSVAFTSSERLSKLLPRTSVKNDMTEALQIIARANGHFNSMILEPGALLRLQTRNQIVEQEEDEKEDYSSSLKNSANGNHKGSRVSAKKMSHLMDSRNLGRQLGGRSWNQRKSTLDYRFSTRLDKSIAHTDFTVNAKDLHPQGLLEVGKKSRGSSINSKSPAEVDPASSAEHSLHLQGTALPRILERGSVDLSEERRQFDCLKCILRHRKVVLHLKKKRADREAAVSTLEEARSQSSGGHSSIELDKEEINFGESPHKRILNYKFRQLQPDACVRDIYKECSPLKTLKKVERIRSRQNKSLFKIGSHSTKMGLYQSLDVGRSSQQPLDLSAVQK